MCHPDLSELVTGQRPPESCKFPDWWAEAFTDAGPHLPVNLRNVAFDLLALKNYERKIIASSYTSFLLVVPKLFVKLILNVYFKYILQIFSKIYILQPHLKQLTLKLTSAVSFIPGKQVTEPHPVERRKNDIIWNRIMRTKIGPRFTRLIYLPDIFHKTVFIQI